MPITKEHAVGGTVVAAAMGLGFAFGHAPLVSLPNPAASASVAAPASSPGVPPPPSKCALACASIAPWCSAGRAFNCADLLTRYEREGRIDCSQSLTQGALDEIGWCPDGGEETPIAQPAVPTLVDNIPIVGPDGGHL